MEKKEFLNKKTKKDCKSKKVSKQEEKSLFPFSFLGINLENLIHSNISDIIYKSISDLSNSFSSFSSEDLLSFLKSKEPDKNKKSIWKYPKSFHITTLFHSKHYDKNSPILKSFQNDKEAKVNIAGMAIVPNNIVTLIVLTDELVDNKYPHITFLIGNYKPVVSNNVMISLFDKGAPYEEIYNKIKKGEKCPMKEKVTVNILDKEEDVYFEIFDSPIEVIGKHKGFK